MKEMFLTDVSVWKDRPPAKRQCWDVDSNVEVRTAHPLYEPARLRYAMAIHAVQNAWLMVTAPLMVCGGATPHGFTVLAYCMGSRAPLRETRWL